MSIIKGLKKHLSVDKELVIVFLMVAITGMAYLLINNQRVFLNFFYLPVLLGAYFFGKKHGTYSAFLSVLMIFAVAYFIPETFTYGNAAGTVFSEWADIATWGGLLLITGYLMGTLYEKKEESVRELTGTYQGIITMLSLVIDSVDRYTQSHSYRVSKYAEKIAREAGLPNHDVEDIRIAALLHDLGKIGVSAEILNKIGKLSDQETHEMGSHTDRAGGLLEPLGGKVLKILPLILGHHERYDGKGHYALIGSSVPIGAKIIAVADVYDALTTDRPYRKALTPLEAKNEIVNGSGTHFDPEIVSCFEKVFPTLDADVPMINAV
jgi:putative nucleotidyltransferase with HDIG domain